MVSILTTGILTVEYSQLFIIRMSSMTIGWKLSIKDIHVRHFRSNFKNYTRKTAFPGENAVWMLRAEMHIENAEMQTKSVQGRKSTKPA